MSIDGTEHHDPLTHALGLLRGHTTGTLLVDGTPTPVLYIVDPRAGSLVLGVEHEMFEGDDIVMVVPEDSFDAPLRVSLMLDEEPEGEATDRFMAYHMRQPLPVWARGSISFVKVDSGSVVSQEQIEAPNLLIDALPGLCRRLNSDRDALREVCKLLAKVDIEDPIAVGIDDLGFDVRARFGVVRVEMPSPIGSAQEAEDVIAALFGGVS
ncbi:MAG: hypothetical protein WD114_02410 [Phycisphaerales bacterium]